MHNFCDFTFFSSLLWHRTSDISQCGPQSHWGHLPSPFPFRYNPQKVVTMLHSLPTGCSRFCRGPHFHSSLHSSSGMPLEDAGLHSSYQLCKLTWMQTLPPAHAYLLNNFSTWSFKCLFYMVIYCHWAQPALWCRDHASSVQDGWWVPLNIY